MKFLDIGANVGNYAKAAIKRGYDVIAVEANPAIIEELKNNIPNQTVINKAVSNTDGEKITLYVYSQHEMSTVNKTWQQMGRFSINGVFSNIGEWEEEIEVDTVTIQSLVEEYGVPDIIKVDVEEHEWEAISSLKTKSPELCFEWHKEGVYFVKKILDHLSELGYKEFGVYICNKGREDYFNRPESYTEDYDSIYESIKSLDKKNNDWGMIWCK